MECALKELQIRRQALVKQRIAHQARTVRLKHSLLKRQNTKRLIEIEKEIKAIDTEISTIINSDQNLKQRHEILVSIPGISNISAAMLLIGAPELGCLERGQITSLAGVAPMTKQSGQWKGRDHIQGGRSLLRKALYMPALVAARYNPDLKAVYQRLVAAGKPPKVAITAVMRKLIVLANTRLRQQRCSAPKTA
jgi:transposase